MRTGKHLNYILFKKVLRFRKLQFGVIETPYALVGLQESVYDSIIITKNIKSIGRDLIILIREFI